MINSYLCTECWVNFFCFPESLLWPLLQTASYRCWPKSRAHFLSQGLLRGSSATLLSVSSTPAPSSGPPDTYVRKLERDLSFAVGALSLGGRAVLGEGEFSPFSAGRGGLLSPWNSPGQNTGVGSLSFHQGIFPTQGSNPGHSHCRRTLYQLSHKGSPRIMERVACPFCSGSSQPRNRTGVSCTAGGFFTNWANREAPEGPVPTIILILGVCRCRGCIDLLWVHLSGLCGKAMR